MIREINKFGSPLLNVKAVPVEIPKGSTGGLTSAVEGGRQWPEHIVNFVRDLTETAESMKANCAGLAATQIYKETDGPECPAIITIKNLDGWLVAVNPIVKPMGKKVDMLEACLSGPGQIYKVKRRANIWISYVNLEFEEIESKLYGEFMPVVFALQHEVDHLNGITIDKIGKLKHGKN